MGRLAAAATLAARRQRSHFPPEAAVVDAGPTLFSLEFPHCDHTARDSDIFNDAILAVLFCDADTRPFFLVHVSSSAQMLRYEYAGWVIRRFISFGDDDDPKSTMRESTRETRILVPPSREMTVTGMLEVALR
ncbi:hypothetical protein SODALDRAFT_360962 [Sodiomyces alkalinus F11]|uniref:Uncharacterized protein n=1 Tax=Sodiomyces alkalinus (strain CBS 110278 / VKM F-3762 / F11) TaxID=1314773 RepID=A0A3N2PRY7_SODAK|nr:hypothetical protein SODALDRAFT_360962 [Sodiomyces alkalinus F11]ROT37265.1 hypothetical protein SODALDRAFT_360962 [Sodiomyces alkalinus F11]